MNRTYQSIWDDRTGTFVAVSEIAHCAGRRSSPGIACPQPGTGFAVKGLVLALMLSFGAPIQALPVGGTVSLGSATISKGAASTTITQSTQDAAINWLSFNISAGEAVRFVQPGSNSVTLNRVLGADPSSIQGSLSANGRVFLVNPSGIVFGKGAQVNVGGLVASTLDLSDGNFAAGNYRFSGAGSGAVLNQGDIHADGGFVALLGASVGNEGVITTRLGTVALAAGSAITLDLAGDGLLNVTVNQGAVDALVRNGGLIQADGGQVILSAQAAGSLLASAVNNTGVVQAQTLENHNGSIRLLGGMQAGAVSVAGRLDASAPQGGDGGAIETSAARVHVADSAVVTTRSAQGRGGNWLIDPTDFTVAAGADIAGATLSANLVTTSVTILSSSGSAGVNGDINVNEAVTWTASGAPTTLTLNAVNDVNFNAAVTATTGNLVATAGRDVVVSPGVTGITTTSGGITWTAVRDINIHSPITTTDGNFTACCGRDINIDAAMTTTRGNVTLRAGADGSGPAGLVGGTVVFAPGTPPYAVTGPGAAVTLDYTPVSYATPHDYAGNFTLTGGATLTQYMLVFAQGKDKVYDGNTSATLSLRGDPTLGGSVTLVPGVATFDDKNVAANIGITYTGYTLAGADAGKFALWVDCFPGPLRTNAAITQAPLTLKANDASKVYGSTFTPAGTAFTTPVAPRNGETVGSVTELSPAGSPPTAAVPGPYAITPSSATGGSFTPSNYTITYLDGALTVTPAPLTIQANDASKVYGTTFAPVGTAFTTPVAPRNGETVGSVTETSPGTVSTAPVVGNPYPITPSGATGGTFVPGNYGITYVDGRLVVTLTAPVVPPVVVPEVLPVVPPPGAPVILLVTPPQLSTLVPVVPPPVAPPPVMPPKVVPPPPAPLVVPSAPPQVAPVPPPPPIYVAPVRARKQDRN